MNSHDPSELGPDGKVLDCESLELDDMGPVGRRGRRHRAGRPGQRDRRRNQFHRPQHRLTYSQAKDLWILEGDGRCDAEVFKQDGGVGTKLCALAAQKILYFHKTDEVKTEGVRSLDMNDMPRQSPPPGRR